jgi:hypothetical protein
MVGGTNNNVIRDLTSLKAQIRQNRVPAPPCPLLA